MITLKQLSQLHYDEQRVKHPNVPLHAVVLKKYNDRSANALQTALVDLINFKYGMAWRQGSEGRYRPGSQVVDVVGRTRVMKGTWLPGLHNGIGDVMSVIKGRSIAWEIKIGSDTQKPDQRKFEESFIKAGGAYVIIKDWDDVWSKGGKYLKEKIAK
jgi:hypothetical protein